MHNSCATAEGTTSYKNRFPTAAPDHFRRQQQLTFSSVGIVTYLGNPDSATDVGYTHAVERAVQLGCNVIDSASNYRFQRSERSIGVALKKLTSESGFAREELIVCTKGGYIPFDGTPPQNIRAYLEENFVRPGIATLDDFVGGSHCMTPRYLQNQLEQSLRNLGLEAVDVYYIHNPESQLGSVSLPEFYKRLGEAFESLELRCAEGKVSSYGVASWNGFRVDENSQGYHSLERMVQLATEVGGQTHHFRFIQLPFNLAMPEALTLQNQSVSNERMSTCEAAARLNVAVVASASIYQGRVAKNLPKEIKSALGESLTDAQAALQFVRSAPGITTALVGMSKVQHVEENLHLTGILPMEEASFASLFSANG